MQQAALQQTEGFSITKYQAPSLLLPTNNSIRRSTHNNEKQLATIYKLNQAPIGDHQQLTSNKKATSSNIKLSPSIIKQQASTNNPTSTNKIPTVANKCNSTTINEYRQASNSNQRITLIKHQVTNKTLINYQQARKTQ